MLVSEKRLFCVRRQKDQKRVEGKKGENEKRARKIIAKEEDQ